MEDFSLISGPAIRRPSRHYDYYYAIMRLCFAAYQTVPPVEATLLLSRLPNSPTARIVTERVRRNGGKKGGGSLLAYGPLPKLGFLAFSTRFFSGTDGRTSFVMALKTGGWRAEGAPSPRKKEHVETGCRPFFGTVAARTATVRGAFHETCIKLEVRKCLYLHVL